MRNYYLWFREVFKYLVPFKIRGVLFETWIASLLQPVQTRNLLFADFVGDTRYLLRFNGQVIYLEHRLNDEWDNIDRRIYIDDPLGTDIFPNLVFNKIEQENTFVIYNKSENQESFIYNQIELQTDYDFIVYVPAEIYTNQINLEMRQVIDTYRIAGKTYIIQTF